MKKNFIIVLFTTLLLTSCFWWKEKLQITGMWKTNISNSERRPVETEVKNWELKVWKSVTIREGVSETFPSDFPIISWGKIYQNSNVQKYAFIMVEWKTVYDISKYYDSKLKGLGWKAWEENNLWEKDSDFIFLVYRKIKEDWVTEEVRVNIRIEIPEIIKNNLPVKGVFVEVMFNNLFIVPENN